MARHTKLKIAALVTSAVAALGVVAVGPATVANAGHTTQMSRVSSDHCC